MKLLALLFAPLKLLMQIFISTPFKNASAYCPECGKMHTPDPGNGKLFECSRIQCDQSKPVPAESFQFENSLFDLAHLMPRCKICRSPVFVRCGAARENARCLGEIGFYLRHTHCPRILLWGQNASGKTTMLQAIQHRINKLAEQGFSLLVSDCEFRGIDVWKEPDPTLKMPPAFVFSIFCPNGKAEILIQDVVGDTILKPESFHLLSKADVFILLTDPYTDRGIVKTFDLSGKSTGSDRASSEEAIQRFANSLKAIFGGQKSSKEIRIAHVINHADELEEGLNTETIFVHAECNPERIALQQLCAENKWIYKEFLVTLRRKNSYALLSEGQKSRKQTEPPSDQDFSEIDTILHFVTESEKCKREGMAPWPL